MEGQEQLKRFKVIKIESQDSWNYHITQANNKGRPIMVHFSASWCMPSTFMNPAFEELASNYQDILFLMVDVDEVKEVASKLEIKAMPTFILLKGEDPVDKIVGANPKELRKRIDGFVQSIQSYQST